MPKRKVPLVTNHFYHVFNRSIGGAPILANKRSLGRALATLPYYRNKTTPLPFSKFLRLPYPEQMQLLKKLDTQKDHLIEVVCFCLMPNHYHLLLRQTKNGGIETFIRIFQDSYAKYFNTRYERSGPLFESRFKAVLVENEEQLIHLSRYIHLNPYTSAIVRKKKALLTYPWSSLPEYLGHTKGFCNPGTVISMFKSPNRYKQFVLDRADYQRKLEEIKHLIFE